MEMATRDPKTIRPEEAARKTRPKALSPMCDRASWMTMRPSRIFLTTPRNGPPSEAPRLASEFFHRAMVSVRVALRVSRLLSRNSVLRAASAELRKVDVQAEPLEQLDVAGVLEAQVLDDGPALDAVGDVVEGGEQVVEERGGVGAPQVLRLLGGHAQDGGELAHALTGFGDGVVDGPEDALKGAARPLLLDAEAGQGGGVGEDGVLADSR